MVLVTLECHPEVVPCEIPWVGLTGQCPILPLAVGEAEVDAVAVEPEDGSKWRQVQLENESHSRTFSHKCVSESIGRSSHNSIWKEDIEKV